MDKKNNLKEIMNIFIALRGCIFDPKSHFYGDMYQEGKHGESYRETKGKIFLIRDALYSAEQLNTAFVFFNYLIRLLTANCTGKHFGYC